MQAIPEKIVCSTCPHFCQLSEGQFGLCRARKAEEGKVIDANYGCVTALALDPIEKKPIAHWHQGSKVLSVGSFGCNMACAFCQNASIACGTLDSTSWSYYSPEELVGIAQKLVSEGNIGLAYTYNEPLVGFEFVRDTAKLAHDAGLLNVIVSNGLINPAPLDEVIPYIDAANIDLKAFNEQFYAKMQGNLKTVMSTIEKLAAQKACHLEVTTLIIPGENDSPSEIEEEAKWLKSLDKDIVLHLTRFFPSHHYCDKSPTPIQDIYNLADVAKKWVDVVEIGNC